MLLGNTVKRALVTGTRFPEIDRDCGSQRIDEFVKTLTDDGWSVTYLATETDGDPRHAHRLRQHGVATFQGVDIADEVIEDGDFDVALLSVWKQSSRLLPIVRERSPRTKVIVDSVDLHFLREARRQFGLNGELDEGVGKLMASELNLYRAVDAVLSVSSEEGSIMSAFLGPDRVYELPLTDNVGRRDTPFEKRRGMFFVGNFRHLPNGEAVEYLCKDILPQVDPGLLAEHPLFVAGSRLDDKVRAHARGLPHTRIAGWIPSVVPYLAQTRIAVIPLLHGAGVKGKVLEALMAGTPVITTPIGAEGLGLVHGEHALIASTPTDFAAAIARLLTDAETWQRLSDAGHAHVSAKHDPRQVAAQLREIVDEVMARPTESTGDDPFRHGRRRELAYNATIDGSAVTLATVTDPGSLVCVISRGDDALVDIRGRVGRHFPAHPDGRWAGFYPADSDAAIAQLESEREQGVRYLAIPSTSFWWLHHYRDLAAHLDARYRKVHSDEHLVLYDLRERTRVARRHQAGGVRPRVAVVGTYSANHAGPPPALAAELERSEHFAVVQHWIPSTPGAASEPLEPTGADWVLHVDDSAVLPSGFVDDFFGLAEQLAELGVERLQPAHSNGPSAGPPVTEEQGGVLAREVSGRSPLPVFAVRTGAAADGAVTIVDAVPIGLVRALTGGGDPMRYSQVLDVFLPGLAADEPPRRAVRRGTLAPNPLVSVLVSTYERPELLAGCLESLCAQSLPGREFEVVVVDDGTPGDDNDRVFDRYHDRLALTWVTIDHAGRGGAKNLAAMLARADVVVWFDDDDRADSDMLAEHLAGHEEHPEESAAILGYTGWAPELTVSPLMHYLTDVDKMLFAYGNLQDGHELDWRGFWEGRISSKRTLHLRHGLHDQRLEYSIDVEMAWRLADRHLSVHYRPQARSVMARPLDFAGFCTRFEAKGRAQAAIAGLHSDPTIQAYTKADSAAATWEAAAATLDADIELVHHLEAAVDAGDGSQLDTLHRTYRRVFQALNARGFVEGARGGARSVSQPASVVEAAVPATEAPEPVTPSARITAHEDPQLTVTIPVWSRTEELADMAVRTIDRIWEVAQLRTEVVVIDNGSPFERELNARVHRFPENRGVSVGWNAGIERAEAPVVCVLNSDCLVEPGWDVALYEAVTTGRRIAFPYTDHGDGEGYRMPDQAGTAGWCFMMTREIAAEIGEFDTRFSPAFCEDTDYWHRAWELGIELSPVPAARVFHERRTTGGRTERQEWLLTAHRYLYGWKHGVEPMRAPPYYHREIVEYHAKEASKI